MGSACSTSGSITTPPMTTLADPDAAATARAWFMAAAPIAEKLPLKLSNGAVVETLVGMCSDCDIKISGTDFRGTLVEAVEDSHILTAMAFCRPCCLLTRVAARLYPHEKGFAVETLPWRPFLTSGHRAEVIPFPRAP